MWLIIVKPQKNGTEPLADQVGAKDTLSNETDVLMPLFSTWVPISTCVMNVLVLFYITVDLLVLEIPT